MRITIVKNSIKDRSFSRKVIGSFEAYLTNNAKEAKEAVKNKKVSKFIGEMITHVENSLLAAISDNFYILVAKNAVYAVKVDMKNLLSLQCEGFDIVVIKVPGICVPTLTKKPKSENRTDLKGFDKYFLPANIAIENKKLEEGEETVMLNKVKTALETLEKRQSMKDLTNLGAAIQDELVSKSEYGCLNKQLVRCSRQRSRLHC